MSTKERILQIRLMEKLNKYPQYAQKLGIKTGGTTAAATERKA